MHRLTLAQFYKSQAINNLLLHLSGLCPEDPFDEAVADMIRDGANDLFVAYVNIHFEKDEAKKVP